MRILVFLAVMLLCSPTFAELTGITVTPQFPVMGEWPELEAEDDGLDLIMNWVWEYRFRKPPNTTWETLWTLIPVTERIVPFQEWRPGEYEVRVTASYAIMPPLPQKPPTTKYKTFLIARATGIEVIAGDGATHAPSQQAGVDCQYKIKSGTADCGMHIAGGCLAQWRKYEYELYNPDGTVNT